jgi:hypothetical protein
MTAFGDTHRGNRVQLLDAAGDGWLPPVLLMEDPRPCEGSCCCTVLVITGVEGFPVPLHAKADAPVRLASLRGDR